MLGNIHDIWWAFPISSMGKLLHHKCVSTITDTVDLEQTNETYCPSTMPDIRF